MGVGKSRIGENSTARRPASMATRAVVSGKKYMSAKQVVPERIISAAARRVPSRTKASLIHCPSAGQMCCSSQVISGRSSARPRNRFMAAWVWAFTRPGISRWLPSSTTSSARHFWSARGVGSRSTMVSPRTTRA